MPLDYIVLSLLCLLCPRSASECPFALSLLLPMLCCYKLFSSSMELLYTLRASVSFNLLIMILCLLCLLSACSVTALHICVLRDLDLSYRTVCMCLFFLLSVPLCWFWYRVVCLVQCTFITDLIICMCVSWSCLPYEELAFIESFLNGCACPNFHVSTFVVCDLLLNVLNCPFCVFLLFYCWLDQPCLP